MNPFKPLFHRSVIIILFFQCFVTQFASAQKATISIPVGIGRPCGGAAALDSLKYFNYNSTSNILSHRSNCKPLLATPGFSSNLSTISFNPYDNNFYFSQIKAASGVYSTYIFRWSPTICPDVTALPVYKTFYNQFVAGVEFDPATGLGYQMNFVDTSGIPGIQIASTGIVGEDNSLVIVNGFPASSFYNSTNKDLMYARAVDVNGEVWSAPIIVTSAGNIGQYTSMVVANGNPAISYYDATNGDLKYVRALDANGSAWGTPVTVDATGVTGLYTSMIIVNGFPAISYYDATNGVLRYVRANDANGTTWGTPFTPDAIGVVGQFPSMKIVNGNPAISYYDTTNKFLRYVRSSDVNGAAWDPTIVLDSTIGAGQYTSMQIVNGNPAVAYYENIGQDLKYVRAADASGAVWGTPVILDATGNTGQFSSLIIVNGTPAISYNDVTNGDLMYIRAIDAVGSSWGATQRVEATSVVGQYTSMQVINGKPAIAYYDFTNKDLKYIRSQHIDGKTWYYNSGVYNMELQEVNFTTGTLGPLKPINFGSRYIYRQSGDVVMTPGGQMLAVFNNKYFTVNWKDYGTAAPLVATYIDTLNFGVNNNLIGLSYSDGKLVSSIRSNAGTTCFYRQIDILTGALSNITNAETPIFSSADMTNIPNGIGAAKKLISAVETFAGSNTYDVIYEVVIKNYGGVPISNLQAYDTLNNINGAANVISGSITSFTAPAGINFNPLYDGSTAGNFNLLVPGSTLSNRPGENIIILRISCRIANILPGVVYYNQARVTGNGLLGDELEDLSTNGSNPDLNGNDKPDDAGEGQPTPLLISVTAQTPPCVTLSKVLFSQDFGSGTGLVTTTPAPVLGVGVTGTFNQTYYTSSVTAPIPIETYTVTNNANNANTSNFISLTDHTGNANGRMLIVNADANNTRMFRGGFNYPLCPSQQYSISFYAAFVGNTNYKTVCDAFGGFKYPKLKVRITDASSGLIITEVSTADIVGTSWQQYGIKFVSPASYSSIYFDIINDADGGCGNDIALDDIQFGSCDPIPLVSTNSVAGCLGDASSFTGGLTDPGAIPGIKEYQWQVASALAGPYTDIPGATLATYTINPVMASDTGKYYRLLVAASGSISNVNCRFNSTGTLLVGRVPSVAAATATRSKNNICAGKSVNLGITGGSLGTGASWKWYAGGCTGSPVGTGSSINVTPTVTTTYYIRAEGDCNTTTCQTVTVFISCNLDKDQDGIPDYIESYMAATTGDHNSNGVINAFDVAYPGFVDNNNDFVNDNFQADGDSDNDGTPNYLDTDFPGRIDSNGDGVDDRFDMDLDGVINMLDLDSDNDGIADVVEAGGVDTDGDGKLDNFTDTDNDGLSQNIESNNTGAYNSGLGLGMLDLDGDGKPNAIDLDSDGDGIPDLVEALEPDSDNDGKVDNFIDGNGDGLSDIYNTSALLVTGADVNNDGRADSYPDKNMDNDKRANPYDIDSDGDGIVDVIEAGFADTDYNGFVDGPVSADGWNTALHALPALGLLNSDGSGKPNYLDIDSDDDGIPDNIEGQTTLGYKFPSNADTDSDGLDNAYDATSGFGGSGIFLSDKDGDTIPDYIDLDTDSDGIPDIIEGNDFNLNGMSDDNVTLTGLDTDGDGLDNRFDSLNSVTNIKGTSYMMGTGGSLVGDPSPGTRSPVQKTVTSQPERDWRYVSYVLPLQLLQLSGAENIQIVTLNWQVISPLALDKFEVERSVDNIHFEKIHTVAADITVNELKTFADRDDIANITNPVIFYRLKVIAKNDQSIYSDVIVIRKSAPKVRMNIYPNPAKDNATVSFYSSVNTTASLSIKDFLGKEVFQAKQLTSKGNNSIPLSGLSKFNAGVYNVQVTIGDEILSQRLIIYN